MFYELDEQNKMLVKANHDAWNLPELDFETLIMSASINHPKTYVIDFFGDEELLIIGNQFKTSDKKRVDILAIDKAGNGVVIELKRDEGQLGIETQALQYLADFSRYKGNDFLNKFVKDQNKREQILGFLGRQIKEEDINQNNRIILVARYFDHTLFSMGEWLCSKNVGFRCVSYKPISIADKKIIGFSVVFDQSPESLYSLEFASRSRKPGIFWHNIGFSENDWWGYLIDEKIITASFDNQKGDKGETVLKSYIPGDLIIGYANGFGAVGYGEIKEDGNNGYQLLKLGSEGDLKNGKHLHHRSIEWKKSCELIENAVRPGEIKEQFGIHHPISVSTGINGEKGEKLIRRMDEVFC